jgi:hypothetical protein
VIADDFRKLALNFPEAVESTHMHHPDFRVAGKIFATPGYPNKQSVVVKLTPEEQKQLVRDHPKFFQSVKGEWGRRGNTVVDCGWQRSPSSAKRSHRRGVTLRRNGF